MRAHYLQHVPFEGLGSIEPWLVQHGYQITSTRLFHSAKLPSQEDFDFLIVMGGPMSVNEEDRFPWLIAEKRFIREVIEAGKPVLGICLGAQLIANTMGATVYRNHSREIGWFPVQSVAEKPEHAFVFPPALEVFHWHGETFDLPQGAVHLARSEGCENQAFQLGKSVIGLQFHLETTPDSARTLVANCRDEMLPGTYVQPEQALLSIGAEKYHAINDWMGELLTYLQSPETDWTIAQNSAPG